MIFEKFWSVGIELIKAKLSEGGSKLILDNWRADKGLTGEKFELSGADDDGVDCLSIYASKKINLPKEDFEALYDMWDDYIAGDLNRMDLIDAIPRPAYCVAAMKYLKDNIV
ncbi:MAG: hypothetical protein V3W18_05835 [candidate division Zixibacteria bacterium]